MNQEAAIGVRCWLVVGLVADFAWPPDSSSIADRHCWVGATLRCWVVAADCSSSSAAALQAIVSFVVFVLSTQETDPATLCKAWSTRRARPGKS